MRYFSRLFSRVNTAAQSLAVTTHAHLFFTAWGALAVSSAEIQQASLFSPFHNSMAHNVQFTNCVGIHLILCMDAMHGRCRTHNEVRVNEDVLAWQEAEGLEGRYSNCFRVGYNRFELMIDFGQVTESEHVRLHSRIVTNPRSAKALHRTLQQSIEEYESTFGRIEETAGE